MGIGFLPKKHVCELPNIIELNLKIGDRWQCEECNNIYQVAPNGFYIGKSILRWYEEKKEEREIRINTADYLEYINEKTKNVKSGIHPDSL